MSMEFSHLFKIAYTRGSHRSDTTHRVSGLVGLRWEQRTGVSNKLPGNASGDAAGPETTTTRLHHPKTTRCLFWKFCFKRTSSRRENTELVNR